MRETYIWRAVFWTFVVMGAVILLARLDPGFLKYYPAGGMVPVSTGQRIEILAARGTALTRDLETDLYFLQKDGAFKQIASFPDFFRCVTDYQGQILVTFRASRENPFGASSSIYKDGTWVRGISAPADMAIYAVAGFRDAVYAVCLALGDRKIQLLSLGPDGWAPFGDAIEFPREIDIGGFQGIANALDVVYVEKPEGRLTVKEPSDLLWHHVTFDGLAWGKPEEIAIPSGYVPTVTSYSGALALGLAPRKKTDPVKIVVVRAGKVDTVAEIPAAKGRGKLTGVWLAELAGTQHVFLTGPGHLWDLTLTNGLPSEATELLSVGEGALIRSNIYVALMLFGALLTVSLGITWLIIRLRAFGHGRRT